MTSIKSKFAKGIITLAIVTAIPFTVSNSSYACGELSYKDGEYSEITVVDSVQYQEGTGTFFFITKGEVEFWVLDIKEEPYTKEKLDYYTNLYKGKQVQVNFTVNKNDITEFTHQLVQSQPVVETTVVKK